jgi:hypothetical protein
VDSLFRDLSREAFVADVVQVIKTAVGAPVVLVVRSNPVPAEAVLLDTRALVISSVPGLCLSRTARLSAGTCSLRSRELRSLR